MAEHVFVATDFEARGLHDGTISAVIRPIRFKHLLVPPDNICPARVDGWVYWNGPDAPDLAEFTKQQYEHGNPCPFGQPGDTLAVKETYCPIWPDGCDDGMVWEHEPPRAIRLDECTIEYKADTNEPRPGGWPTDEDGGPCWQSPVTMRREFVRLRPTVANVQAVRVQALTEADIIALGTAPTWQESDGRVHTYYAGWADDQARRAFAPWWDARWARRGLPYSSNPWAWLARVEKGA